jgi:glutaminase
MEVKSKNLIYPIIQSIFFNKMSQLDYDINNLLETIFEETINNTGGDVARYIPQLANVNPDLYGISCCGMDGTVQELGDTNVTFSLQSCSKPLNYCLAKKLHPELNIHKYVGYEPSGRAFNEFIFNKHNLPHNPMINAGAIMVNSLVGQELEPAERFDLVKDFYHSLGGAMGPIGFDNSIYLSEQNHADRNISLAYEMRSNKVYHKPPSHSKIQETLNLYFQSCSVSINCKIGSLIAATLANGGINPVTKERVLETNIVKDCLSLMYSCGMYDYSGQFSFEIGLPAKSGVSGCLLLVVPNYYGICIWSPRLDHMGNSVRGVDFCKRFVKMTHNRHHIFNILNNSREEPQQDTLNEVLLTQQLISAAALGNLKDLQSLAEKHEPSCLNVSDYDGRTPLHLACSEGQLQVVKYLLQEQKCHIKPKDRWGNTPLHDANKRLQELTPQDTQYKSFQQIVELIKSFGPVSDTDSESR